MCLVLCGCCCCRCLFVVCVCVGGGGGGDLTGRINWKIGLDSSGLHPYKINETDKNFIKSPTCILHCDIA